MSSDLDAVLDLFEMKDQRLITLDDLEELLQQLKLPISAQR